MKNKLLLLTFSLCFVFSNKIFAEQLSKIGIINLSKIASQYYKESRSYQELEQMMMQYEEEKNRILEEIDQLEARKLDANTEGDEILKLKLENEIFSKKQYLREYNRIKLEQIRAKRDELSGSDSFLNEIMREIDFVAETEGYSVILKSNDPNLIWWSSEVDITELVLERLLNN